MPLHFKLLNDVIMTSPELNDPGTNRQWVFEIQILKKLYPLQRTASDGKSAHYVWENLHPLQHEGVWGKICTRYDAKRLGKICIRCNALRRLTGKTCIHYYANASDGKICYCP